MYSEEDLWSHADLEVLLLFSNSGCVGCLVPFRVLWFPLSTVSCRNIFAEGRKHNTQWTIQCIGCWKPAVASFLREILLGAYQKCKVLFKKKKHLFDCFRTIHPVHLMVVPQATYTCLPLFPSCSSHLATGR